MRRRAVLAAGGATVAAAGFGGIYILQDGSYFGGNSGSSSSKGAAVPEWVPLRYEVDPARSQLGFRATRFRIDEVPGEFRRYTGVGVLNSKTDLDLNFVAGTVEADSVDTGNRWRDAHLRSDEYLAAKQFPQMHFRSTCVKPLGLGENGQKRYCVAGDMEMRGIRRQVELDVEVVPSDSPNEIEVRATGAVQRFDFGIGRHTPSLAMGSTVRLDFHLYATSHPLNA